MSKSFRFLFSFFFFLFFSLPLAASAGTLSLSAPTQVKVGDEFRVSVIATDGSKIDTVRIRGSYPTDLLEWSGASAGDLPNVSPGNSVNPTDGTFSFGTFTLTGGLTKGTVSVIRFRAKKEGTATIAISNSSLMLAAGVNMLTSLGSAKVQIMKAVVVPPTPSQPLFNIVLTSPTNPSENQWTNRSTVSIAWQVQNGSGDPVYIDFTPDPQAIPKTLALTSPSTFTIPAADGIYYVIARSTAPGGQIFTKRYRILVDRTPPQKFEPSIEIDPTAPATNWLIRYASLDNVSGISRYEIFVNDEKIAETPGTQNALSYSKTRLSGQELRIIAYDGAGNTTVGRLKVPEETPVQPPPAPTPAPTPTPPSIQEQAQALTSPLMTTFLWEVVFASVVALILWLFYTRHKKKQKSQAKAEGKSKRK